MARSLIGSRITVAWLALVAATCLSWESAGGLAWTNDHRVLSAVVLVIAFVKVRVVMREFMDLREAPFPIRLFVDGWATLVCACLIAMHWLAAGDPSDAG
jgi:hypothetical protein